MPNITPMNSIDLDYLEFLAWVDQCMFPVDLADDFREMGMELPASVFYEISFKEMNHNGRFKIVYLYQTYCITSKIEKNNVGDCLQRWLDCMHKKWKSYPDS